MKIELNKINKCIEIVFRYYEYFETSIEPIFISA